MAMRAAIASAQNRKPKPWSSAWRWAMPRRRRPITSFPFRKRPPPHRASFLLLVMDELSEAECLCGPLHVAVFRSLQHRLCSGSPHGLVMDLFWKRQEVRAQIVEGAQLAPADLDGLRQLSQPLGHNTLTRNS